MMTISNPTGGAMTVLQKVDFSAAGSFSFTSIPSGWKRFFIEISVTGGGSAAFYIQFNDDNGNNYKGIRLDASGGAVSTTTQAATNQVYIGLVTTDNGTNCYWLDQRNYAAANKTIFGFTGFPGNLRLGAMEWLNATDEITKITLTVGGNTATGSATLYGVKVV